MPPRMLPFPARRTLQIAATLSPGAATRINDACIDLLDEFILTRPDDVGALATWLRTALRTTTPQPILSPAHYFVNDLLDVVFVSHGLQALFGIVSSHFLGQQWAGYVVEATDVVRIRNQWRRAIGVHGFIVREVQWRTPTETVLGSLRVTRREQGAFHGWTAEILLDGVAKEVNG